MREISLKHLAITSQIPKKAAQTRQRCLLADDSLQCLLGLTDLLDVPAYFHFKSLKQFLSSVPVSEPKKTTHPQSTQLQPLFSFQESSGRKFFPLFTINLSPRVPGRFLSNQATGDLCICETLPCLCFEVSSNSLSLRVLWLCCATS